MIQLIDAVDAGKDKFQKKAKQKIQLTDTADSKA